MCRSIFICVLAVCHMNLAQHSKFPDGFVFGVSTSAYQIEGAWNVGGKSESIWDRLSHTRPELIVDGTNGDIACDSYHRFLEDVDALAYLGVDFYRFSLSWSRLLPTGRINHINPDGYQYYNNLLDALSAKNLTPVVILYNWDLPQNLQDLGGWANPIMIDYFRDYAEFCFTEFGDKVKSWITFNGPYEICEEGYGDDKNAPAIDSHGVGNYLCSNTVLKAHAEAYHLYNNTYRLKQNGTIMISISSTWFEPSDPQSVEHIDIAETANQFYFGWFAHPIFSGKGGYPDVMVNNIAKLSDLTGLSKPRLRQFDDYWIERIKGTSDYLGVTHYATHVITGDSVDPTARNPSWLKDMGAVTSMNVGSDLASEWLRAEPAGFGNLLRWCKASYGNIPIYITENGYSDHGSLDDYRRIKYFHDYLSELLEAVYSDAVKVKGYSAWTLMDSFEWHAGFSERFGLYYVNITDPALPRTPKLSAEYYRRMMSTRELPQLIPDFVEKPTLI